MNMSIIVAIFVIFLSVLTGDYYQKKKKGKNGD